MRYIRKPYTKSNRCILHHNDDVVQSNLAYTPADMLSMASRGVPIQSYMLPDDSIDMGESKASFDIPLERKRSVDVAQLWQASQTLKRKFKKSVDTDIIAQS